VDLTECFLVRSIAVARIDLMLKDHGQVELDNLGLSRRYLKARAAVPNLEKTLQPVAKITTSHEGFISSA
jgi:hypothetical protein